MSLLFYMAYRATNNYDYRGKLMVVLIQFLWIVFLPLLIIKKYNGQKNLFLLLIGFIVILIFNYVYYFREVKQKEILKKYTYKYPMIENHPLISFIVSYFGLLITWFIIAIVTIKI